MYQSKQSRYCYPETDVLINKANLRELDQLERFEKYATTARLHQLNLKPINGNFDFKHLSKIHWFIFQDVYPFAGKVRDEDISKGNFRFALPQYIYSEADRIIGELKQDNYLKGLSLVKHVERLAYYMAELNVLHPFREGNGRTLTRIYSVFSTFIWARFGLESSGSKKYTECDHSFR
ncbi:Fic/DOC family protein [Effusibacillus consociatus]|uniref:protein adenylyltransferase n=1 Tax=Effusibacillus consociatus TaxID=1117041 RepID=A0ABV9Q1K2_9BACL